MSNAAVSQAAVFERRNKQIQEALHGRNLRQALQLCEKRIKKGENTHFLLAWKAYILSCHPDEVHQKKGIEEALRLCHLDPPVTDMPALDLLHDTLEGYDEYSSITRYIWERASKVQPQAIDIQLRWFTDASREKDWKAAQKAAMGLQNNFKDRKYYFWAVFMCYLISISPSSGEVDRNLFGTLAYRMISKAADSVPSDPKELLSPSRAIQTPEELLLLIKIYQTQSKFADIAELLSSKHLGIDSRIAQQDWSFVEERLWSLERAGLWNEILKTTKELLSLSEIESVPGKPCPNERDDYRLWELLLKATESNWKEAFPMTKAFAESYINKRPKSRNAQLFLLDLTEKQILKGDSKPTDLVDECKKYFDLNGHKTYAFPDLRKYLANFDYSLIKEFQNYITERTSNKTECPPNDVTALNVLKLEYCFHLPFDKTNESMQKTENFVSRCIRLYLASKQPASTDAPGVIQSQPKDDLCLLAAMSTVKQSGYAIDQSPCPTPQSSFIQAAAILEQLLVNSPHNYEALLLLVRIYLLLGAGSMALKTFHALNVKQIQHESVSHNLFTRLSTIHPGAAPPSTGMERKDWDPQIALRIAMEFYYRSAMATEYSRTSGLEYGSYVNISESIALEHDLQHSICRKIYGLEVRRIQRLTGLEPTAQYADIIFDTTPPIDKRSSEGFINCEPPGKPTFEEHIRLGPIYGERGTNALVTTDALFLLLGGKATLPPDVTAFIGPESDLPRNELTPAEFESSRLHLELLKSTSSILNKDKSVDVNSVLPNLKSFLSAKSESLAASDYLASEAVSLSLPPDYFHLVPSWKYLHNSITLIETLKVILVFISFVSKSKEARAAKDTLDTIKNSVNKVANIIKENTKVLKERITASGVLNQLVSFCQGPDGTLMKESFNDYMQTSFLELTLGSLMDSWEEALDSVIQLLHLNNLVS